VRRRAAIGAAAVAVLAAVAAAVALAGGSGDAAEPGAAAKATGTGTVARRTLAERVTVEGTIGYAGETTVLARLTGTVTALPAIGDVVRRGERLYALAGEPVLLLYGSVPAYRTLAAGVADGPDVEQLERNLAALGYEPGTLDEEFTASTAAAIESWQDDLGLEASGEIELGRVAFLRGPQRVTELEATLGEALGGGGAGGGNSMVAWRPEAGVGGAEEVAPPEEEARGEEEPGAATKPPTGENEKTEAEPEERKAPPAEEGAKPEASGGEPAGGDREEGAPEAEPEAESEPASTPVLHTTSTNRVVTVDLDPNQQAIAERGQEVGVVLPGGAEVKGVVRRLTAVESSAEGAPGEEAEAAVEATVAVTGERRIPALDGAAVSVVFTQRVRKQVLSVPLTALVAIGGERFAVYAREDGGRRRIVVTPGLAADGYVEVRGKGLRAGMQVETGA
jgi:peptidoglycan hydrolase-like protein with peptidoglycan-binding domain